MAENREEEQRTFQRLNAACEKFLGITLTFLGGIRQDKTMVEAVRRQTPLMQLDAKCKAGQDIFALALKIQRLRKQLMEEIENEPILKKPRFERIGITLDEYYTFSAYLET